MQPVFFERPSGPAVTLRQAPRLASWNRAGDTGAARLTRALDLAMDAVSPRLAACAGPVALRFDVGLPRAAAILEERDLDNYLLPLTAHLAARTEQPVASVWGTKRYAEETTLTVGPARPRADGAPVTLLEVTATGARDEFKAGLRERVQGLLAGADPLPDGPVALELAFAVGPGRDWLDLWWSTVDGLGPILGETPAAPAFHPRDGRVVDLGLHRTLDPALGDDVRIALCAAVADPAVLTPADGGS